MHTYRYIPPIPAGKIQPGRKDRNEWWEVGIYAPGASNAFHQRMEWLTVKKFAAEAEAAEYVHFLNGEKR